MKKRKITYFGNLSYWHWSRVLQILHQRYEPGGIAQAPQCNCPSKVCGWLTKYA